MVILGVVGLIQLVSYFYYESKMLKQPIILASEIQLDSNQINLSYITNFMRPSELQSIEIDGMHYYPQQDNGFMFNNSSQRIQDQSYANYAYYAIFSPTIWLQSDESKDFLANATEGTVYFSDGYSEKLTLTNKKLTHYEILDFMMTSVGTDGTEAQYRLRESFTLNNVTVVEDKVELTSFKINNKEVTLPLIQPIVLHENDTIFLATTDGMARFEGELFVIELNGFDQNNNEIVLTHRNNLNSAPSAQWVEEFVKERGNK